MTTTTTTTTTTPPTPIPTPTPTPTPLLLYSFLLASPNSTLVVPVANGIAYSIIVVYRYSSQDAHDTDRPVLIWYAFHWVFKHALATQAASDLRLCLRLFFSQEFHLACASTSLGAISLRFHPVSFHAVVCCQARGSYIVPGATLLGAVQLWYTVNRLLQQPLLQKPLLFYGFVLVFLSYYSSSSPSFLFCSLAVFHLECTSNSLGATSLWPAGLPEAIKYKCVALQLRQQTWCLSLLDHPICTC